MHDKTVCYQRVVLPPSPVCHQVEAIHPFTDGNGRTGRILNLLYLVQEKLISMPILYLSRFIIRRKSDYYSLLIDVTRKEAWEPWILFLLEAVTETAKWTIGKIAAIRKLMDHAVDYIKTKLPKSYSRELVEIIFTQPYCRIANLVDLKIAKRETASVYLKRLCNAGVLEERKSGRENQGRRQDNLLILHTILIQTSRIVSGSVPRFTQVHQVQVPSASVPWFPSLPQVFRPQVFHVSNWNKLK